MLINYIFIISIPYYGERYDVCLRIFHHIMHALRKWTFSRRGNHLSLSVGVGLSLCGGQARITVPFVLSATCFFSNSFERNVCPFGSSFDEIFVRKQWYLARNENDPLSVCRHFWRSCLYCSSPGSQRVHRQFQ